MKKVILIQVFLFAVLTIFAQQGVYKPGEYALASELKPLKQDFYLYPLRVADLNHSDPEKNYDYYMKRRKNRKTVGWITLGAGFAFAGIGTLIANNDNSGYSNNNNGKVAAGFLIASAASGLVSIPFMIMATVNKNKAKAVLKNQATGFGAPAKFSKQIPGIGLVIPINK